MTIIDGLNAANFGCLIETLYEAAQNTDAWESVMALLCQYLSADSALIRFYAPDWSEVEFSATHGYDPSFDTAYRKHFLRIDPVPRALGRLSSGSMTFLEEIVPFERLKHTEFYNDYMRPQDKRYVMGGYVYNERGAKTLFGLQRGHRGQPFGPRDKALLKAISPHLIQVLRVHHALAEAKACSAAANRAMDALNIAAFFLDKAGRVRFSNPSADSLVRTARLLTVRQGYLHTLCRQLDFSLQRLILSVTQSSTAANPPAGGAVRLAPPGAGSNVVTAIILPWRRPSAFGATLGPHIVVAVFVGTCARLVLRAEFLGELKGELKELKGTLPLIMTIKRVASPLFPFGAAQPAISKALSTIVYIFIFSSLYTDVAIQCDISFLRSIFLRPTELAMSGPRASGLKAPAHGGLHGQFGGDSRRH